MMKDWKKYLLGYCLIAVLVLPVQAQILQIGSGTSLENYAASELQRYYYQLSGKLLNIERTASANLKSDFILTTLDNPRVAAARKTHTKIHAYVHHYNDPLPPELIIRFTTKNGIPKTWGDAINLRIRKQKAEFRKNSAYGSFDIPQINS